MGNFLMALAQILSMVLNIFMWIIIIRALISWVNPDPYNPIVQFLYRVTDPVLYQVKKVVPMPGIGIDFSPIVVILIIYFLQIFAVQSLMDFSRMLQ